MKHCNYKKMIISYKTIILNNYNMNNDFQNKINGIINGFI